MSAPSIARVGRWAVPLQAVTSSNVEAVGYEPAARLLVVRFKGRPPATYVYHNVAAAVYAGCLAAPSKGKYLHKHVITQPGVECERLPDGATA